MSLRAGLFVIVLITSTSGFAETWDAQRLYEFTDSACTKRGADGGIHSEIVASFDEQLPLRFRNRLLGTRYRFSLENNALVELAVVEREGRLTRFVTTLTNRFGDPLILVSVDGDCALIVMRRIDYTDQGQAIGIVSLDRNFETVGETDWFNPPLVLAEREASKALKHPDDATPVRVALVDSGVNYQLPEINRHLALDARGKLIGFDFWDMDDRPFDANPVQFGFFLQRHGTRTASILLREAPGIELVPYRYPRPDMSRMQDLVEHAVRHDVAIIGLPLGSDAIEAWGGLEEAAQANPEILFIASAGNDGRNIDEQPLYPASLDLQNLLVVTSSDDFVRPAGNTNWGRISVDYLVPAERIGAIDYSGEPVSVSGSSYAVARVTALAARLLQNHRDWQAADIIAELELRYANQTPGAKRWVSRGYIGDPQADGSHQFKPLPEPQIDLATASSDYHLSLDLLILEDSWIPRADSIVQRAFEILRQCEIGKGQVSARLFAGADYLRDLSTGTAQTLFADLASTGIKVVFARDTRMQEQYTGEAFGIANTKFRPWLANSVWLTVDVDDPAIALAHELYHVLANSGAHVEGSANLMQGRTRPDATTLTAEQCQSAQETGSALGLLNRQ